MKDRKKLHSEKKKNKIACTVSASLNPLTPESDHDRISPYYIYTISCRQVMRIKKNTNYENLLIDPVPNFPTNKMKIIWQTVRRITTPILGVKGLTVP